MLFGILDNFILAEIAHPVELARRQDMLVVRADPESRNLVRHLIFLRPRVGNDRKYVAFDVDDQIIHEKRVLLAQILAQELADAVSEIDRYCLVVFKRFIHNLYLRPFPFWGQNLNGVIITCGHKTVF